MLKLGNSYLGFTDDKTPMQRARIEKGLDKVVRTKQGEIEPMKQLIYNLILEGRITEMEENCQHYKKDGTLTKPKTEYHLIKDGRYLELNKTEYDFANYILDNKFNDIEKASKYVEVEINQAKELKRQEQEQEEKEKQLIAEKEKAEKEFKEWLNNEVVIYPENDKYNIAKDIYSDEIGVFSERQIELLVLIDNIDNPVCKKELSNWLSYYNTASLKAFYHITGIKLGKTDKEIKAKLKDISSKDFQGMIKYNKKPIPEGYKKFYKLMGNKFEESYGEHIQLKGFNLYITIHSGAYNITEGKTGVIIGQGYSREEAIESFNKITDEYRLDSTLQKMEQFIIKNGLSPLYQDKIA